jgi:hypothetical protein
MSADGGELLYPPPRSKRDTPRVDAVRGFVFLSGLRWMESHGHLDRYRELLPADLQEKIHFLTASAWIELPDALRIYASLDELKLSMEEQIDLGRSVVQANNGVVINTVSRLVGKVASPWIALQHADKAWGRSNRGGAIAVYKLGEKIARLEFWQVPLAQSPFFVTSMRGAIAFGIESFCDRVVVTELPDYTTSDAFALRAVW